MDRRQFLEAAGRTTVGMGIASPLVGTAPVDALADDTAVGGPPNKPSGFSVRNASGLATTISDGWSIATDPDNAGRNQSWFTHVQTGAKPTRVPSIIQEVYPFYHGVVWFWVEFTPGTNPYRDGRSLLRFSAVDYLADVWLNGTYLGAHEGGEFPFTLDVTDAIKTGKVNLLAVRVLNPVDQPIDGIVLDQTPHRNKFVKHHNGALYDFGGIIQPVDLFFTPAIRVDDVYVRSDWKTGQIQVQVTVRSSRDQATHAWLSFEATHQGTGPIVATNGMESEIPEGKTVLTQLIEIKRHRLWSLDDPFVYRMSVRIGSADVDGYHEASTSFGFRDFRVTNGYFRLNDRRIFLKSTHTGNHVPFGLIVPPDGYPDILRKDLVYAKACGFNTVRFISGSAYPYQLDLCDELGLIAYQETAASWLLKDSPQMKARYERSLRELLVRDRNHPSFAIFGTLNETEDGAVFKEAVSSLSIIRSIDSSTLVILSSGRFDGHLEIGSISNPGNSEWELTWGKEAPGGPPVAMKYPSGDGIGDFHLYPKVPQSSEVNQMMRTLGEGGKPIFLSEYGIGSMMDIIHEARMYEEAGVPKTAEDYVEILSMCDRFSADWFRFGMDTVYPYPEILLSNSQLSMARHRLLGFNLIRSNPLICGFNLTGMLDHALTGEGVWRFWRDWKPGAFDAMCDGWAPVRWCLFAEPAHTYVGKPMKIEAVLANEDAVRPGEYDAQFQIWGPRGSAWEKKAVISIPGIPSGQDGPLAVPVMKEEVVIQGPSGAYELVPFIAKGIAPPETSWRFYLTDPADFPQASAVVSSWRVPANVEVWLGSRGIKSAPFNRAQPNERELILVGDVPKDTDSTADWIALAERMATGSTVVFLAPTVFQREKDSTTWLPLTKKGKVYKFDDFLYHKECVGKLHPIFNGLQSNGLLDWYYYGPTLPSFIFDGQDTPTEVVAAAFAAGYSTEGGYASGILLGSYRFGAGHFVINTFSILENIGRHPVADRLLLNLIQYSAPSAQGPAVTLPADFSSQLKEIGYID